MKRSVQWGQFSSFKGDVMFDRGIVHGTACVHLPGLTQLKLLGFSAVGGATHALDDVPDLLLVKETRQQHRESTLLLFTVDRPRLHVSKHQGEKKTKTNKQTNKKKKKVCKRYKIIHLFLNNYVKFIMD